MSNTIRPVPGDGQTDDHTGLLIGDRYKVVKTLAGGMGVVHLCLDLHGSGFPVALKTFRPEFLPDDDARERFLREAGLWVGLGHHRNIVQAYGVEYILAKREVYIVLQLVHPPEGYADPSLRSWLNFHNQLSIEEVVRLGLGVVRGMRYATTRVQGLVHRDLKPENILVGFDRIPRICDFGLATIAQGQRVRLSGHPGLSQEPDHQLTDGVVGTLPYMSPEQCLGQPLDARSDVYAFGCILYELLAGELAVWAVTPEALVEAHVSGAAEQHAHDLQLPSAFKEIVVNCLRPSAGDRYQDWTEVEAALTQVALEVCELVAVPDDSPIEVGRQGQLDLAQGYLAIGASYLDIGRPIQSADYCRRALKIGETEESLPLSATAHGNLGLALMQQGDAQQALECYQMAFTLDRKGGDLNGQCARLGNMGAAYQRLGRVKDALNCFTQALQIAENLQQPRLIASQLGNLGVSLAERGDLREAILHYERAIALFRQVGDLTAVAGNAGNLGNAWFSLGDWPRAQQALQTGLQVAAGLGNLTLQATLLGNLGNVCHAAGNIQAAQGAYEQALSLCQKAMDRAGECSQLIGLGLVHASNGQPMTAKVCFRKAVVAASELDDRRLEQAALDGLAQVLLGEGKNGQAVGYLRQALEIALALRDRFAIAKIRGNLGVALMLGGDLREARQHLEGARTEAASIGVLDIHARATWTLGLVCEAQHDYPVAAKLLADAVEAFGASQMSEHKQALAYLKNFQRTRHWS